MSYFSGWFGGKERRILILGLDGAGKTTILYRLQVGEVVTTIPSKYQFYLHVIFQKNVIPVLMMRFCRSYPSGLGYYLPSTKTYKNLN